MSLLQPEDTASSPFASTAFGRLLLRRGAKVSSISTMECHSSTRQSSPYLIKKRQEKKTSRSLNIMEWLQQDCPQDLLPKILAFTGPQMIARLFQTNRFWYGVISQERTWQMLCQDLYKWKDGDEVPRSWREHYIFHPCVPCDYASIDRALSIATNDRNEQNHSICVLLRPGRYVLNQPINIQAEQHVQVKVKTMDMPESFLSLEDGAFKNLSKGRRRVDKIRKYLSCRTVEVEDFDGFHRGSFDSDSISEIGFSNNIATLEFKSNGTNEPLFRICKGNCVLKNLKLNHISQGIDIWNGNAAVHIQPFESDEMSTMTSPSTTALLDHVEITSGSGRGIVNCEGGNLSLRHCYIHDCAATGVYVGGNGSQVNMEHTDVLRNGIGNTYHRRGIGRGHSGIYLERGTADIIDSNISENILTGITAVSPSDAILHLKDSELVSNGLFQLELPGIGTEAERQSSTTNVTMLDYGNSRSRSGFYHNEGD